MNQPYNPMGPQMPFPPQMPVGPQMPFPPPMQPPMQPPMAMQPYQPAFHPGPYPYPAGNYPMDIVSPNTNPMPWMGPYHDPSMSGDDDEENILTKKYGGVPVWGWALAAAAVGGVGFVVYQKVLKKNEPGSLVSNDRSDSDDDGDSVERNRSGEWSPSRSGFGAQIDQFLKDQKIRGVKVYIDADEAAKSIKTPSPLITLRVPRTAGLVTHHSFITMCKTEGLRPVETADGIVGLYPDKSKRGKAWEEYIDALRDEGQQT